MLKKETVDFLCADYWGVLPDEIEKTEKVELLQKCIKRAYRDFNRTLRFSSKSEKDHKEFYAAMETCVKDNISVLLKASPDGFDCKHQKACEALRFKAEESKCLEEDFTYGHGQKWLNMTLKYMQLLGCWDERLDPLKSVLHVPVDRYILKAAAKENNENAYALKAPIAPKEHKEYDETDEGPELGYYYDDGGNKSRPWSKFNTKDYIEFQTKLREAIKSKYGDMSPIEWEGAAWIAQAKAENS